jgi:hypothetical protein
MPGLRRDRVSSLLDLLGRDSLALPQALTELVVDALRHQLPQPPVDRLRHEQAGGVAADVDTGVGHQESLSKRAISAAALDDEVVAAAVLHDVLQRSDLSADVIEQRFGPRVRALVETLTEDPGLADYEELARLRTTLDENRARGEISAAGSRRA